MVDDDCKHLDNKDSAWKKHIVASICTVARGAAIAEHENYRPIPLSQRESIVYRADYILHCFCHADCNWIYIEPRSA